MQPSNEVVESFGGDIAGLQRLEGGQGTSWRAGDVVLKPAGDDQTAAWIADFVDTVEGVGDFRIARPKPTADGRWSVDGWAACTWLDGRHVPGSWDRILEVSESFHRAARASPVEWPDFLRDSTLAWSVGDRVAWGDEPARADVTASVRALLDSLGQPLARPVAGRPQVIHSDLAGNVVFADDVGLRPAILDVSPRYRPSAFADAIVVADAVAWEGAPLTLALRFLAKTAEGDALLARAIVFRVIAASVLWDSYPERVDAEVAGYRQLVPLIK